MFCKDCGSEIPEGAAHCGKCGAPVDEGKQNLNPTGPIRRSVPQCTHCGYVGEWKLGPVLRGMDIIIGLVLMLLGVVPGLVYMGVVAVIRSNKDNREKICPKCKAKNLWTFQY